MFGVKTRFGMIGRLFGVPRAWLSQVGGFCSSWKSVHNIIRLNIPDFPSRENPITIGVDEESIKDLMSSPSEPEETTQISSSYSGNDFNLKNDSFTTDGASGCELYVCCRMADDNTTGGLYFRKITISEDGRIYSIGQESTGNCGTVNTMTE